MLKRKLVINMLLITGICTLCVIPYPTTIAFASTSELTSQNNPEYIYPEATSIFGKSKTVTKNYTSQTQIPASIYYTEYIDGAWWGGTLKHTSTKYLASSGLYQATFTGTIRKQ